MGMLKYKNTQFPPSDEPWGVFVGDHRGLVYEVDGYVEIEDWDDLANWHILSSQRYELVTDENPDPKFGDTDMLAVIDNVEANAFKKKQDEQSAKVVAEVEAAIAEAKAKEEQAQTEQERENGTMDNTTAKFINEDGTEEKIQLPAARDESKNEPPTAEERQLLERTGHGDEEATTELVEQAVGEALDEHVDNSVEEAQARQESLGSEVTSADKKEMKRLAEAEAEAKKDAISIDPDAPAKKKRSKKGPYEDASEAAPEAN